MDQRRGTADRRSEGLGHRLHPKADPQGGNLARDADADRVHRDPRRVGVARPRRDNDATQVGCRIGRQGFDAGPVDGVVAQDVDLGPGRFEGLDQVESEAVVIVDHENHGTLLSRGAG